MNRVYLLIIGLALVNFVYIGATTRPWESDSLDQHIPVAGLIASGRIWGGEKFASLFHYYPANAHLVLAGMQRTKIPLNLFNVFGWLLLFFLCRKIGGTTFASAIAMLPTVLRLLPTQTVDIWVAVSWVLAWQAVEKKHYLSGLSLGLLSGAKYSGLPYAAVLWLFYLKQMDLKLILGWFAGGGFWYVRNWLWLGNPIYPAGDPRFKLLGWQAWMTTVKMPAHFATSLVSEFLVWPVAVVAGVNHRVRKLIWLAAANFGVYLILPSWPENTLSDLRYAYPAVIPLILAFFKIWPRVAEAVTLTSVIAALTQLDYHPKLIAVYILMVAVYVYKKTVSVRTG